MNDDEDAWRHPPSGALLGPLPVCTAGLVVGAWAGGHLGVTTSQDVRFAGAAAALALLAVVAAVRTGRHAPSARRLTPGPVRGGVWLVAASLAVGVALTTARTATTPWGLLPSLAAEGGSTTVTGRVVHEPRRIVTGWHVLVQVDAVGGVPTRERAATTLDHDHPPPLGQRFVATSTARPFPEGGYGRWLAQQHATVVLDVVSWHAAEPPGRLARASEHVRDRVRRGSQAHTPPAVAGLLAGLATGDTRTLPDADRLAMEATSLTHLTAVSGTHVALVTAGVHALCLALRLPARARRATLAVTLLWFAFVTRFEPSVLRAGTMAAVVLLAGARGHARDARHALAGAVLLLVLLDPLLAGALGLLLSATAAGGVLVLAPMVRPRLHRLPDRLADVLAVTLGAQIAVVPLLLTTFGTVPLASVPANVVAVPAAALAASIGFVAAAVSSVHLGAGSLLFALAGWPARVVLFAAHAYAGRGGGADTGRPLTVAALAAGCVAVLARPRTPAARVAGLATAAVLAAAIAPAVLGSRPPTGLVVTAIDVGQGDAFLVESPAARILVDTGEDDRTARWLRANGRRRLDLVVLTHPHADHIGGAAEVVRTARIGAVWMRPLESGSRAVDDLLQATEVAGVPVRAPVTGDRVRVGDLAVEVLGPDPGRPYRFAPSEPNETSIVVRITWQDRRALFAGDAERTAQGDLLARNAADPTRDLLAAELLAVPHHGAATTDPAFLRAVAPQVAVIGVGADNDYGHPSPAVLRVLEEVGARVHRTDRDGTVEVAVPPPRGHAPGPRRSGRRHPRAVQTVPSIGCRHAPRVPARRRRRPAPAPRTRAPPGRPARAGPGAGGRDL
ncbi:ComEC/Rec2 family competence protein [Egicoccus sp. AB-alg6-2]|uniref:ComEC/Rec2 family competence protein n=1 Tax=Egicoccus sp. AB-alg6-2 TaxID=3242692 RepID=UPI00359E29BB